MREWVISTAYTGYEFLLPVYGFAFTLTFLVLIPLGFIKKTRAIASVTLFFASYLFGITTWLYGVAVTFAMLGWFWLLVGFVIGGIGVVPLGMIASLIQGEYSVFFSLIIPIILVVFTRWLALKWGED